MQPPRNMVPRNMGGNPNPYARNYVAVCEQRLPMQEGQVYTGDSLIIPATLVYDVLPAIQGDAFGPTDFEITDQELNLLNEDLWGGLRRR